MMTHDQIWNAIDALAARNAMSVSRLAREAGLDATTFNRSKRVGADGRPRWPSTESISKVLAATGSTLDQMMGFEGATGAQEAPPAPNAVPGPHAEGTARTPALPLIDTRAARGPHAFDPHGRPQGGVDGTSSWTTFDPLPDPDGWALDVADDALEPLYRRGDRLLLSPGAAQRPGDALVARTHGGELIARILVRRTADSVELRVPDAEPVALDVRDLVWSARVLWTGRAS